MSKRIDVIAAIVIILAGIVMLYLWWLNPEFRTLYVGEPFADANQFIPGANFKQLGFLKLRFTADYAVGPSEYHPFYYTHNPPLSEIINGIYHKLGLERIEWQRLVCIMWTLVSFFFFYRVLRLLAGSTVAFWSLLIVVSNPFVLYWGDNLDASHQWMFVYASFYFFLWHIRQGRSALFFIAWSTFFCAAFCNYELIPLMVIFALGLRLFKLEYLSNRKLFIFFSAPLVAFCLRNLLIIWALGFDIWYRDLIAIFLHRTFGITTSLLEMYKHIPVVLWVPEPEIPQNYLWHLYIRLENLYGYGWSLLLVALVFPFLRHRMLPLTATLRLYRLILLFFVVGTIWYFLFPQHTSEHFHSLPMVFFVPFSSLLWSSVLVGLWQNIKRVPIRLFCSIAILSAIVIARTINFIPPKPFPGIDTLRRYKGKVFCTNAIPTIISYFTKAPAAFCGYESQLKDLIEGKYYFFLRSDRAPLPRPEFFFCVYEFNKGWLERHFPLVEQGEDYAIYRLQLKPSIKHNNFF